MSSLSLTNPHVIQEAKTSSEVTIREVHENYELQTVSVELQLSSDPDVFDIFQVWGPEDYNIDWTQSQLEAAIIAHYDAIASESV